MQHIFGIARVKLCVSRFPGCNKKSTLSMENYKHKLFLKKPSVWLKVESGISVAVSNESDDPLNDTPTSSPPPLAEMAMSWACHFIVVTP